MIRFIAYSLVCLLAPALFAQADPRIQAAQQTLKDQGFYFGEVDGQPGKETESAIRRYQIRNGLDVTGQLNTETRTAMGLGAARTSPSPARVPEQAYSEEDQAFLERENRASTPPPAAPIIGSQSSDNTSGPAPADASSRQRMPELLAEIFRGSPYEYAPGETQQIVVRDAQVVLARWGFYQARVDGVPGPAMRRAILEAQRYAGLRPTGRLDAPILRRMHMMPYPEHPPIVTWFNSLFGVRPLGQ